MELIITKVRNHYVAKITYPGNPEEETTYNLSLTNDGKLKIQKSYDKICVFPCVSNEIEIG